MFTMQIRNPFNAILAERKRIVSQKSIHTSVPSWREIVLGRHTVGDVWRRTARVHWSNWTTLAAQKFMTTENYIGLLVEVGMPVHTIRYEDLLTDLTPTLAGALQFIGEHVPTSDVTCHAPALYG